MATTTNDPRLVGVMVLCVLAAASCSGKQQARPPAEVATSPASAKNADHSGPMVDPLELADGEDALAKALKMNSDEYAAPPHDFRSGHVTKAKLDASAVQRSKGGFEVQLPSGAPVTTPTVYANLVMVSGGFRSKEFHALRLNTGEPVWGLHLDDDGPSTAACAERVCVWNTESCTIFAVQAETGEMLWSLWLGDPLMSAPTIAGGKVFTAYPASAGNRPPDASHALIALDLKTGRIEWQRWIDADVMSAPVAHGGMLYVATLAGTLYKIDQKSGTILAAKARRVTSAPVIDDSGVYYTRRVDAPASQAPEEAVAAERPVPQGKAAKPNSGEDMMGGGSYVGEAKPAPYLDSKVQQKSVYHSKSAADDAANGFSQGAPASAAAGKAAMNIGQGSVASLQAFQGSRLLRFGAMSISSMGDEVVGIDAATGKRSWAFKLAGDVTAAGGFLAAPPAAAGGRVVLGTLAGKVRIVDPKSGKQLGSYDANHPIRSQPVIHRGWIYVGTTDGRMIGIDTGDESLTGWPMWGRDAARSGKM